MRLSRVLAAVALLVSCSAPAHAQHGCARVSWGTCDPWIEDKTYAGPGTYQMVLSVFGNSDSNVGSDSQIRLRHRIPFGAQGPIPDAWRFDDAGCQTGSRLHLSNDALNTSCPAMLGANPQLITLYGIDVDGSAYLRLAVMYDTFQPVASTRYTLWLINFDLSLSNIGPTPPDHSTCGGIDECMNFYLDFVGILHPPSTEYFLPSCNQDPSQQKFASVATWNDGCQMPDPTLPTTWGRVKASYR